MDDELRGLLDRWIIAFLDHPTVLDRDLMRSILEEHEAASGKDRA